MKFDRRYWIFIAAAVASSTTASASTLYMAAINPHFRECNSVSAACFAGIGMVPCMVLGILALIPVMIAIPCLFRQNERLGLVPALLMGCIVAYTFLDAVNNIAAVMNYQQAYLFAHSALSTTNNLTGTVAGTGESLC